MEGAEHTGLKNEVIFSQFMINITETANDLFFMLQATIIQPWFNEPHAGVSKSYLLLVVSQEYLSTGSTLCKIVGDPSKLEYLSSVTLY